MLYLDSSALVKRYVAEPGSADVASAIERDAVIATSRLTIVEVRAALAAARRAGRFRRAAELAAVIAAFTRDWAGIIVVEVDASLCESAASLADRHGLRGYDAVQLASAIVASSSVPSGTVRFGTFDTVLRRAARAERLALLF